MKSGSAVRPGRSRECDILQPSSSELTDEVPLLALSDLSRVPLLSAAEVSLDASGSVRDPPDDCCLRLRYSDMDNYGYGITSSYKTRAILLPQYRHDSKRETKRKNKKSLRLHSLLLLLLGVTWKKENKKRKR